MVKKCRRNVGGSFNTQPRGGGCRRSVAMPPNLQQFQHTAARRRLLAVPVAVPVVLLVSTHSRAEAAALKPYRMLVDQACFNTQPRGGGCLRPLSSHQLVWCFNTQPRGGGCSRIPVKTHYDISFNTQPRGGGCLW